MENSQKEKTLLPIGKLTLGLCGDVMIGRLVDAHGERIWGDLLPLMHSTDFTVANLEAALTHSKTSVPKVFNFKSDPKHVDWLHEAKIDVVNLANNHVLDYATEGLLETLSTLDKANILHVGAGCDIQAAKAPVIIEKHGIKIGIIGYTDNEPGWLATDKSPGVNVIEVGDIEQIKRDITQVRKKVDILIASQHIGPNMVESPPPDKIRFAHNLIDAGFDLIHSHSSHIFQGVELYKNKLILYDTGDFVDDYYVDPYLRNDQSFFFIVELAKEGIRKLTLVPVFISNLQVNIATGDEKEAAIQRMINLSARLHTSLQPTELGLELAIGSNLAAEMHTKEAIQ